MCGYILSTIENKKKFLSQRKFLIHRGPDSQKYIKRNGCFLYHSRLKILTSILGLINHLQIKMKNIICSLTVKYIII